MKKPQYTRQTKPRVKRWQYTPETWIELYTTQLNGYLTQRNFLLSPSTTAEVEKEHIKNKKGLLVYKKQLNKEIKDHNKRIRFYKKKHSRQPKPLDIFQRYHPSSQPEAIEAIRNSPEALAYIQETFADIDSGPFKGMFTWQAGFQPGDYFKDSKPRLYVMVKCFDPNHGFKINNKIHAYKREWMRLAKHSFAFFELDKPNASNAVV
jgi:hypothetical protein